MGDVVLIPFPFTDLTSSKRRPALLIARPDRDADFIPARKGQRVAVRVIKQLGEEGAKVLLL